LNNFALKVSVLLSKSLHFSLSILNCNSTLHLVDTILYWTNKSFVLVFWFKTWYLPLFYMNNFYVSCSDLVALHFFGMSAAFINWSYCVPISEYLFWCQNMIYIYGFFLLHRGDFYWIVLKAACIKSCVDLTVMLLFIWCYSSDATPGSLQGKYCFLVFQVMKLIDTNN
jgi:hypothetical protein